MTLTARLARISSMVPVSAHLDHQIRAVLRDSGFPVGAGDSAPHSDDHPRTRHCAQLVGTAISRLPLHGYDSLESVLKVFSQHGIMPSEPAYEQAVAALRALTAESQQFYRGIGKPGMILDRLRCGGSRLIRASSLARASLQHETDLREEIAEAIDVFLAFGRLRAVSDLTETHQGKHVIRSGMSVPSYYHLLLLSYTRSWRAPGVLKRLRKAVARLPEVPPVYVRSDSQLMAPARLDARCWNRPGAPLSDAEKALWIDRVTLVLRADILPSAWKRPLRDRLRADCLAWFATIRDSKAFLRWGAYTGIGLEPDWMSRARKEADLLYRIVDADRLLESQS